MQYTPEQFNTALEIFDKATTLAYRMAKASDKRLKSDNIVVTQVEEFNGHLEITVEEHGFCREAYEEVIDVFRISVNDLNDPEGAIARYVQAKAEAERITAEKNEADRKASREAAILKEMNIVMGTLENLGVELKPEMNEQIRNEAIANLVKRGHISPE